VLTRLEVEQIPLVCEWDPVTGEVGVAFGGEREQAWAMMKALHGALLRATAAESIDQEMSERIREVCGMTGSAIVWRATFSPADSVQLVPHAIRVALGEGESG